MTKTIQAVDLEQIERLADKVRALVDILERTRAELSKTIEDNQRLQREVESMRKQLSTAATADEEMTTLLAEREQIGSRVREMLQQLEDISV